MNGKDIICMTSRMEEVHISYRPISDKERYVRIRLSNSIFDFIRTKTVTSVSYDLTGFIIKGFSLMD